jgi:hypothetical protein
MAYSVDDGSARRVYHKLCAPLWTQDLHIGLPGSSDASADFRTFIVPLRHGDSFPELPAAGIKSESDLAHLRGVNVVSKFADPGPDASRYAFDRRDIYRNVYRIPIHQARSTSLTTKLRRNSHKSRTLFETAHPARNPAGRLQFFRSALCSRNQRVGHQHRDHELQQHLGQPADTCRPAAHPKRAVHVDAVATVESRGAGCAAGTTGTSQSLLAACLRSEHSLVLQG